MGLEKSSLDLQIESPPLPISKDLAEFQDSTINKSPFLGDFCLLKGLTTAKVIPGGVEFF